MKEEGHNNLNQVPSCVIMYTTNGHLHFPCSSLSYWPLNVVSGVVFEKHEPSNTLNGIVKDQAQCFGAAKKFKDFVSLVDIVDVVEYDSPHIESLHVDGHIGKACVEFSNVTELDQSYLKFWQL